jgi:hypothetical protein
MQQKFRCILEIEKVEVVERWKNRTKQPAHMPYIIIAKLLALGC